MGMAVIPIKPPYIEDYGLQNDTISVLYIDNDLLCTNSYSFKLSKDLINVPIPTRFSLNGVEIDTKNDDVVNFHKEIMNIVENNGNCSLINDWIDSPEGNTVSILYNNILVFPDIFNNLTCTCTHPKDILQILKAIHAHTKIWFNKEIICPQQRLHWYEEHLVDYLNNQLRYKRELERLSKLQ